MITTASSNLWIKVWCRLFFKENLLFNWHSFPKSECNTIIQFAIFNCAIGPLASKILIQPMNETEKINQIHLTSTTVIGLQAVNSDTESVKPLNWTRLRKIVRDLPSLNENCKSLRARIVRNRSHFRNPLSKKICNSTEDYILQWAILPRMRTIFMLT